MNDAKNRESKIAKLEHEYSDAEEVIELSCDQRQAVEGEPVCVACGRYGAYICDTYEVDICSKECKKVYYTQKNKPKFQLELAKQAIRKVSKVDVMTEWSSNQRLALPHEDKCLICKRLGVGEVLNCGKICSVECKNVFLTPDNLLVSPPFKVHSEIACLTPAQLFELRLTLDIAILEGDTPPVVLDFKHAGFNNKLLENIAKCGFELPTAVQSQAMPVILDGSDILVASGIGTGKTGAYLLPLIHRISVWVEHVSKSCILGLVLLPTRELALHVEHITKKLCQGIPHMKTGVVVGGLSAAKQNYRLDSCVQIVIATPGRLIELAPDLSQCYTLILDECDVLLDPSFHHQVKDIIRRLPARHQTLMFSATVSEDTKRHAKQLLYHPVHITVGKPGTPADKVKQIVMWVDNDCKKKKLMSILEDKRYKKLPVLVFVESKLGALLLADFLITKDVLCAVIHGDKTQEDRTKIISELETGRYPVLVSTNILGRGLDLPSVLQVVLFDMPQTIEQYTHQVGRAYTRGKRGTALVFINNSNKTVFLKLREMATAGGIVLPIQLLNSPHLAYQQQSKLINDAREAKQRVGSMR